MSGFRLIDLAAPLLSVLPEVETPAANGAAVSFDDKVVYTISAAFIYLFFQLPLAGVPQTVGSDPLGFLRPVFAAEKGTMLEFGVFPIVASGLVFQLLAGLKLVKVDFAVRADRALFQSLQKIFAIFQYFALANILLATGYFGYSLSLTQILVINLQLVGAGTFVTLIAEVLDKDYGFGSGALTFIAVNTGTNFAGDLVGFISLQTSRGWESQGALINLINNVRSKPFTNAIVDSFTRPYLPNLTQAYVAIATVLVAVYFQNFRIELPIRSNRVRSVANVYPIKLLYTGAMPLLFSYVVLFYLNIIGYTIVNLGFKNNDAHPLVKVLGHYTTSSFTNTFIVDSPSVLYFLQPPQSFYDALSHPLKTVVFSSVILFTSTWFANHWSLISGSAPKDIAVTFKEQGISLAGRRDISISKELSRVVPTAAVSGAAVLAGIAIVADWFGSRGKSAALIVGIGAAFGFLELVAQEYQQGGGSQNFSQFFGQFN